MSKLYRGAASVLIVAAFSGTAIAAPCGEPTSTTSVIVPGAPLTLHAVMAEISNASPQVRRAALETKARQAEVNQAGRRLNPVVNLEFENFAGSGALSGFGQSETTLSFAQTFELGNKRSLRREAASAAASLAVAECGAILRQSQLEAAALFFDLEASLRVAEFANDSARLAEELVQIVTKRVNAGAAAPPELSRVKADAAALKAASEQAKAQSLRLRFELAGLWGNPNPQFAEPIVEQISLQGNDVLGLKNLRDHPKVIMALAQEDVSEAVKDLAKSAAIPDVTLSAGVRRFDESNENAFLLGVSVPFPIFDKKRDAVTAAGFRIQAEALNRQAVEADLLSQHNAARIELQSARKQLDVLETEALSEARAAYEASIKGYQAGKFDLTTTLDTRKNLIEAGLAVINATRNVQIQDMKLRSLTGASPFTGDIQ